MTDQARQSDAKADDGSAGEIGVNAAAGEAPLDSETMAAIRSMLQETELASDPVPASTVQAAMPIESKTSVSSVAKVGKKDRLPPISAATEHTARPKIAPQQSRTPGIVTKLMAPYAARVKSYRPAPKHIVIAALALLVFFRPWLVMGIVLLGLLVFIGVFLILGYDGFWQRGMAVAHLYADRNPERAAEIHARLDRFAMKWDAVLDKFPDGTVDGLYLPDFQEIAAAEARHEAVLDRRLKDIRENNTDSLQA